MLYTIENNNNYNMYNSNYNNLKIKSLTKDKRLLLILTSDTKQYDRDSRI